MAAKIAPATAGARGGTPGSPRSVGLLSERPREAKWSHRARTGRGDHPPRFLRDKVVIASKFGWNIDLETGERRPGLNRRPEHVQLAVEGMLKRLRTDRIDLLYQHRVDPQVPIEDVAGAILALKQQGKVLHWGLPEMGLKPPRRAHATFPLSAV